MTDPVCNLCERKLSEHTYEESIKCAMELIKQGHKKLEWDNTACDNLCQMIILREALSAITVPIILETAPHATRIGNITTINSE